MWRAVFWFSHLVYCECITQYKPRLCILPKLLHLDRTIKCQGRFHFESRQNLAFLSVHETSLFCSFLLAQKVPRRTDHKECSAAFCHTYYVIDHRQSLQECEKHWCLLRHWRKIALNAILSWFSSSAWTQNIEYIYKFSLNTHLCPTCKCQFWYSVSSQC